MAMGSWWTHAAGGMVRCSTSLEVQEPYSVAPLKSALGSLRAVNEQDRDILMARVDENVTHLRREAIPEIKDWQKDHDRKDDERFGKIFGQQSYWRGALAFAAFIVVAVGALSVVVIEHIYSGAR